MHENEKTAQKANPITKHLSDACSVNTTCKTTYAASLRRVPVRRVHVNKRNLQKNEILFSWQKTEFQLYANFWSSYAQAALAHHSVSQNPAGSSYSVSQNYSCTLLHCKRRTELLLLHCKPKVDCFQYTVSPPKSFLFVLCKPTSTTFSK